MQSGMCGKGAAGPIGLEWQEIKAWSDSVKEFGVIVDYNEQLLIKKMSDTYAAFHAEAKEPNCIQPFFSSEVKEVDSKEYAKNLKAMLRGNS